MKNRLLFAFFFCFLIVGNLSSIDLDSGGIIAPIIIGKTCTSTVSGITIPDEHLTAKGELLLPLYVVVYQNDNTVIYKGCSMDEIINIPLNLTGTFYLEVSIGDYRYYDRIHLE